MHQLCQLCFFITSFENMSTLPNFAQLCPTMHFSHSLFNRTLQRKDANTIQITGFMFTFTLFFLKSIIDLPRHTSYKNIDKKIKI